MAAVAMAPACMVGASGPLPSGGGSDAGVPDSGSDGDTALVVCSEPANDYRACVTGDAKAGWCVPDTGCIESCAEVSAFCWTFSYAWPNDPEMQHDPICWCTDDEWPAAP